MKFYKFQSRHSGKKRGYRCCRSPYGSVVANGDSPSGCLRSLFRNPRRVALNACTPFGLQHGPAGRPSGRSSRRAAPCAALEQFQSENALSLVSSGNGQKFGEGRAPLPGSRRPIRGVVPLSRRPRPRPSGSFLLGARGVFAVSAPRPSLTAPACTQCSKPRPWLPA